MAKVLVTLGGTKIPIDEVRDITNMSSGTFGSKIIAELLQHGHDVFALRAIGSKSPFICQSDMRTTKGAAEAAVVREFAVRYGHAYREETYRNFEDYREKLFSLMADLGDDYFSHTHPEVVVLAAAVSDYGVTPVTGKVRSGGNLTIELHPLPKIITEVKQRFPACRLVGFKLLVGSHPGDLEQAIMKSIEQNGCDVVIGNDLRDIRASQHRLTIGFKEPDGSVSFKYYETDVNDPDYLARMVVQHTV